MHFLQRTLVAAVTATAMVASGGVATAHGINAGAMNVLAGESHRYTGSWPVTVSRSQHSDGTFCLTLNDSGSGGWPHSGTASIVIGTKKYSDGSFQVINHTLIATIPVQAYSQNAGLVFIGSASRGNIGPGVFEDVYGGSDFDSGALAFGNKGGC